MRARLALVVVLFGAAAEAAPAPPPRERPAPPPQRVELLFDTRAGEAVVVKLGAKETRFSCEGRWEESLRKHLTEARPRVVNKDELLVRFDPEITAITIKVRAIVPRSSPTLLLPRRGLDLQSTPPV